MHFLLCFAAAKEENKWERPWKDLWVGGWVGGVALIKFPGGFDLLQPHVPQSVFLSFSNFFLVLDFFSFFSENFWVVFFLWETLENFRFVKVIKIFDQFLFSTPKNVRKNVRNVFCREIFENTKNEHLKSDIIFENQLKIVWFSLKLSFPFFWYFPKKSDHTHFRTLFAFCSPFHCQAIFLHNSIKSTPCKHSFS